MARRTYVYVSAAIVIASLSGLLVSPFGVLQAIILTVLLLVVAADSLSKADRESSLEPYPSSTRSRIAHYARIVRVTDSKGLRRTAANPFELALLDLRRWSSLTERDLRDLGMRVAEEPNPSLPRPVPRSRVRR